MCVCVRGSDAAGAGGLHTESIVMSDGVEERDVMVQLDDDADITQTDSDSDSDSDSEALLLHSANDIVIIGQSTCC